MYYKGAYSFPSITYVWARISNTLQRQRIFLKQTVRGISWSGLQTESGYIHVCSKGIRKGLRENMCYCVYVYVYAYRASPSWTLLTKGLFLVYDQWRGRGAGCQKICQRMNHFAYPPPPPMRNMRRVCSSCICVCVCVRSWGISPDAWCGYTGCVWHNNEIIMSPFVVRCLSSVVAIY